MSSLPVLCSCHLSLCFALYVEMKTPFLSVLFFPSHINPACSFPQNNKQTKQQSGSINPSDPYPWFVCSVFFSPLSLSSTHTLTQSDTGQVGGVYHSLMSLVDSVMSVVDSWDCRKKDDECCHQCSCLVCRNPQLC